jgi:hypothetical protein
VNILNIPPFFRGDGLVHVMKLGEEPTEFGDFMLLQGQPEYSMMRLTPETVGLARLSFVVNPSLAALTLRKGVELQAVQSQGQPMLDSFGILNIRLNELGPKLRFRTPLLAFGGLAGDRWLRFGFTRNPHSLSDYGWVAEETPENSLTPEWVSSILSHGQEISHA